MRSTRVESGRCVIASLFSRDVVAVEANPQTIQGVLRPEEEIRVRGCVPKRRREFRAGRLCAREAMRRLEGPDGPILWDAAGAPRWPEGITGSIAHADRHCAVVLARDLPALGLDIERVADVEGPCWRLICVQQELAGLRSLASRERQKMAALLFSAKECFYKCQYTLTKQWLDFQDVAIAVDRASKTFCPRWFADLSIPSTVRFLGTYLFHDGHVFTGITARDGSYADD